MSLLKAAAPPTTLTRPLLLLLHVQMQMNPKTSEQKIPPSLNEPQTNYAANLQFQPAF